MKVLLTNSVLLILLVTLSVPACAQSAEYIVSPNRISLTAGARQQLQVLDEDGRDVTADAAWSIESGDDVIAVGLEYGDALVADRQADGQTGPPYVAAQAPGRGVVKATISGRDFFAMVTVYPGKELPPGTVVRSMPPLVKGARVQNQLQSSRINTDTPDLYVLEGTDKGSYVRAFFENGMQKWVWPSPRQPTRIRLACGDNLGGAVLAVSDAAGFQTVALRDDGTERWRVSTGPWWAYTYTGNDLLYVVEDHPDVPMLTAFDGKTGERKVQIPLPANLTQHISYVPPPGPGAHCDAASSISRSGPSSHGSLITDEEGTVNLAVETLTATFDATGCAPSPFVGLVQNLQVETHLQLLSISSDGVPTWRTIRRFAQKADSWEKPTEWLFPWGSTIPDGHGGVLVPVRGQIGSVVAGKAMFERGAVFRVDGDSVREFQMPVLPPKDKMTWNMLLGENDRGFFAGDRAIVAFNVADGKVLWTWESTEPLQMVAVLNDNSLVVELGVGEKHKTVRVDANGKYAGVFLNPSGQ